MPPVATVIATVVPALTPTPVLTPVPGVSSVMVSALPFLAKWLSSGTLGIALGILGGGGALITIWYWIKRAKLTLKEAKYQLGITNANTISGKESLAISEQAENTTKGMDEWIKSTQLNMEIEAKKSSEVKK